MNILLPVKSSIEYLPHFTPTIKELGGVWNDGLWVLPEDAEVPDDIKQYEWNTNKH